MSGAVVSPFETVLRDELVRADRALTSVAPVLGHILASDGHSMVSDAIVARVRGMLTHIASQLIAHLPDEAADTTPSSSDTVDALAQTLATDATMLSHLHAAAMEGLLTDRLEQRAALDPVLSPLWQELIASQDAATAETAMQALAAQSRFMQEQRRMHQDVNELPAEALEKALRLWTDTAAPDQKPYVKTAKKSLRADYDEAQTRTGLMTRLISSMGQGVVAALELEHAGLALFASGLAQQTGQSRDRTTLACHEHQTARLALALRAAGLGAEASERQFLTLNPSGSAPHGLDDISAEKARVWLQNSAAQSPWDGSLG